MGMSTRSLQIKMQALDLPVPVEWLRTRRLETAAGLLRSGMYSSIGKVADAVGMSHSYFSRAYLAHTGRSPRDDLVS
jgi:transcriptional regulator GlxA family with amidase domain